MNTARTLLDQADSESANAALVADIVVIESQLAAAGQTIPARPSYDRADLIATNDALTAHKAALLAQKSVGPVAPGTTGKPTNLTEKVLAEKARQSSSRTGSRADSKSDQYPTIVGVLTRIEGILLGENHKPTLTERVLAERGVKTLAELNAQNQQENRDAGD